VSKSYFAFFIPYSIQIHIIDAWDGALLTGRLLFTYTASNNIFHSIQAGDSYRMIVISESAIDIVDTGTMAAITQYTPNPSTHHYRYIAEAVALG
jgi:hypothetical protein